MLIQPVVPLVPQLAVAVHPVCRELKAGGLDPARPGLSGAGPGDEAGSLEYLQVLGDGLLGECERLGQLPDGRLATAG
jgi:hypothetical protein